MMDELFELELIWKDAKGEDYLPKTKELSAWLGDVIGYVSDHDPVLIQKAYDWANKRAPDDVTERRLRVAQAQAAKQRREEDTCWLVNEVKRLRKFESDVGWERNQGQMG